MHWLSAGRWMVGKYVVLGTELSEGALAIDWMWLPSRNHYWLILSPPPPASQLQKTFNKHLGDYRGRRWQKKEVSDLGGPCLPTWWNRLVWEVSHQSTGIGESFVTSRRTLILQWVIISTTLHWPVSSKLSFSRKLNNCHSRTGPRPLTDSAQVEHDHFGNCIPQWTLQDDKMEWNGWVTVRNEWVGWKVFTKYLLNIY